MLVLAVLAAGCGGQAPGGGSAGDPAASGASAAPDTTDDPAASDNGEGDDRDDEAGDDEAGDGDARSGADLVGGAHSTQEPDVPVRVMLPSIDVDASVIGLDLDADGTIEVPPDGADAGWYQHGTRAGESGPTVIGAHIDWSGEPGAFADLDRLAPGDVVTVEDGNGAHVAYRVDRLEQHVKEELPTFEVYGATTQDTLRLVTCAGPFDNDQRSYRDNLVVFATAIS